MIKSKKDFEDYLHSRGAGLVPHGLGDAVKNAYQEKALHDYQKGDLIKASILVCDNCKAVERMFVRVTYVNQQTRVVIGTLDNDPIHGHGIVKYGDTLRFSFDDIIDHRKNP